METIQLKLNERLMQLKQKNPRFSQRSFAQKLGLSSGALNEILQGRRRVSYSLAEKLAERLLLSPSEKEEFLSSFKSEQDAKVSLEYLQINNDQFHAIADWPHFAILNLVKAKSCEYTPRWFSDQLNLSVGSIQTYLERLLRLGFLKLEKGKYVRSKPRYETTDDVLNLSIQKAHLEDLELIKYSLSELSLKERDTTSITLLVDPSRMAEFKKWIRSAQDKFSLKFETTNSSVVYRMVISLFPLKKNSKGEGK